MTDHPAITPQLLELQPKPDVDLSHLPDHLTEAVEHAHGTDDPVFAPVLPPRMLAGLGLSREVLTAAEGNWLAEGFHYGLHIEHRPLENAGPMTGGGHKFLHHITVSPWESVDAMYGVLRDKRAAPHFVIGGRHGFKHPVLIQMIPFRCGGRALEHPSGPPTNTANAIQLEICAMSAADIAAWPDERYKAVANLIRLFNYKATNAHEVDSKLARSFTNVQRFSGPGFVTASGHCGHMHVPQNTHIDPTTSYRGGHLMDLLHNMPHDGYAL